jgi:hypothetical protein
MRPQRTKNGLVITTAVAVAALLLTACGTGQPQSQGSPEPASSSSSKAGTSTPAPTSAASGPPSSSSAPAGPALCKAADLTAAQDSTGGGAAGSVYAQLVLTNSGSEPCLLKGFPGVSLTADANGAPIGAPAKRDESTPVTDVLVAPGQAGTAVLRYTQAGNYPECTITPAAGYRIYPPEDTASLFVAQPRDACSNAAIELLTVGAFQAK